MSDNESSEDEIEPKLKYLRLSNDIQSILLKSSATSLAVHPKVSRQMLIILRMTSSHLKLFLEERMI